MKIFGTGSCVMFGGVASPCHGNMLQSMEKYLEIKSFVTKKAMTNKRDTFLVKNNTVKQFPNIALGRIGCKVGQV